MTRVPRVFPASVGAVVVGVVALVALPAVYAAVIATSALIVSLTQAWVTSRGLRNTAPGGVSALEAQLNFCRRRDEPADILVIDASRADGVDAAGLARALRCTDAVGVLEDGPRVRVAVALHRHRLDRCGLERRLAGELGGPLSLGWAGFPEDGWTVDTLTDHAVAMIEQPRRQSRGRRRFGSGDSPAQRIAIGGARRRLDVALGATSIRHEEGATA